MHDIHFRISKFISLLTYSCFNNSTHYWAGLLMAQDSIESIDGYCTKKEFRYTGTSGGRSPKKH